VDPSNGQHLPLTLNPAVPNSVAVPLANHRDNVEQVVINAPAAGLWQIQVRGFSVPKARSPMRCPGAFRLRATARWHGALAAFR